MRTLTIIAAGVLAVLVCVVWAQGAERTAWQGKAETAVKSVVTEAVAEKIRAMLFADGKNGRVGVIAVEPDGEGVLAKITVKWSGIVIAIDYNVVIRWRFTAKDHLNAAIESAFGMGVITDKDRTAIEDYFRKELYPLVQAAAAK